MTTPYSAVPATAYSMPAPTMVANIKVSATLPQEGVIKLNNLLDGPSPIIPFSRATIYRMIADGRFPKPKKLGATVVWPVQTIRDWINA